MNRKILGIVLSALAAMLVGAGGASAGDTPCNGLISNTTINGNVKAGPGCVLEQVTVNGEVKVVPGGSLTADQTTITKNLTSKDATGIDLFRSSVGGNVHLEGTTGDVFVRSGSVGGNVDIHESSGDNVYVQRETIGRNVHVHDNTLVSGGDGNTIIVGLNTIEGNVDVKDNSVANAANNQIQITLNDHIGGNVHVHDNAVTGGSAHNFVFVIRNSVDKNLEFDHNTASGATNPGDNRNEVSGNAVTKKLDCHDNMPPASAIFAGPNTAEQKKGECASL